MDMFIVSVLIALFLISISFVCYFLPKNFSGQTSQEAETLSYVEEDNKDTNHETPKASSKSKKSTVEKRKEVKDQYSHPWLFCNLKGHSGTVLDLDFSANGKYLASCSDDRSVLLWSVKTFGEKNVKSVRANVEYDHATRIRWSPDGKAFIVSVDTNNTVQVYRVGKKKDGTLGNIEFILDFPKNAHQASIISIGIACNGLFIMTCSSDTTLKVWDLKGNVLATVDTLHINNFFGSVSPCGRFVASSGFTPDVHVWEVCFTKTNEFKEVKRAFDLKGHSSGVYNFSFSSDSTKMVTVSKDGTWKLWDTNIEYSKGQEPYLLRTCKHGLNTKSLVALSPDGRTIIIGTESNILIYSGVTGDLQASLTDVHSDPIQNVLFSPDGRFFLVAAGRHIRVFHNLPGYKNCILGLEAAKKEAPNKTMKERLQSQIEEAKLLLKALEELT